MWAKAVHTLQTNRRVVLVANGLIWAAYLAIMFTASTAWTMLAGVLVLALLIRWTTMILMSAAIPNKKASFYLYVAFNLIAGPIFSALLFYGLYFLFDLWPSGVKAIVYILPGFVAYKSTFPLPPTFPSPP